MSNTVESRGPLRPVRWEGRALLLLDQRRLPEREEWLRFEDCEAVARAITSLVVRGAPAIGVAAAYAVVLAARAWYGRAPGRWRESMTADLRTLEAARPTAVNLAWAVERMRVLARGLPGDPYEALLAEAHGIAEEDLHANRRMGEFGADLIERRCNVLTHCNAGALATSGYGTALGVVRSAFARGLVETVYADETRPWLQGARLTAWELARDAIPVRLLADGAASHAMRRAAIEWVIVGADRVAANGDVANKIGTYQLAISARHHGIGFMVVAPCATIDAACASGADIPIEQRDEDELLCFGGKRVAPASVGAWNPVFDVTPADLVSVLVTERGAVHRPDREKLAELLSRAP